MGYKAVIFDLDGTLLNTLEDLKDAVNAALRSQGLPERSLEEVRDFVGNGIVKLMERAVPEGSNHPEFDTIMKAFRAFYGEHCQDKTLPYPGVLDMLRSLRENHIRTAVVSNKADFAVRELIPVYFDGLIDTSYGENEAAGIRKKPSPDMVQKALSDLDCQRECAVYVGDSDVDLQTAANAGMDCIGVSWGFRGREFLQQHGAQVIIDDPSELFEKVISLNIES